MGARQAIFNALGSLAKRIEASGHRRAQSSNTSRRGSCRSYTAGSVSGLTSD